MIYKFSQIIYSQRPHLTSYHVNGVTVTDVDHCLLECQRTQSCSWFTFHPDRTITSARCSPAASTLTSSHARVSCGDINRLICIKPLNDLSYRLWGINCNLCPKEGHQRKCSINLNNILQEVTPIMAAWVVVGVVVYKPLTIVT